MFNRDDFVFQTWWLSKRMEVTKTTKFQLNISKVVPARPSKHRDMGRGTWIPL